MTTSGGACPPRQRTAPRHPAQFDAVAEDRNPPRGGEIWLPRLEYTVNFPSRWTTTPSAPSFGHRVQHSTAWPC
jgi:hypothetical protein